MITGFPKGLFGFQELAVDRLLALTASERSKQTIVMKAPTGAGKTIILIDYIDEYFEKVNKKAAFIWLCPGKGDLERQSLEKMKKHCPMRKAQDLSNALLGGFEAESTTFINWELVTKKGNSALGDGEKKNIYDRIAEAHRAGVTFIVIIDEEHSNNTAKAKEIIDAFSAKNVIRVSATAVENKRFEYFEIDETDVIEAGLITKAIYVNEGVADGMEIKADYDCLLELADSKRKAIFERYKSLNKNIRPLVLIQFPSGQPETIAAVEKKLEEMGYTYDNGMVSKWMSGDKRDLPDNLTQNDGIPVFLLMKQAISTGWDCPRAKILVKLREGMSESFEIQTIGRIRRMPEAKQYNDDLLDFCYIYTFDDKFKAGLLQTEDRAWIPQKLFLKQKCKDFTLEKQTISSQYGILGDREIFYKIFDYYVKKYRFGKDEEQNKRLLSEIGGYQFGDKIINKFVDGVFVLTDSLKDADKSRNNYKNVNVENYSLYLLHSYNAISSAIMVQKESLKTILKRLFLGKFASPKKLLNLNSNEFRAFIINNENIIKKDLNEVTAQVNAQLGLDEKCIRTIFRLPEEIMYRYDPAVKNEKPYNSNAYEGYTSGYATSVVKSVSEYLFEKLCEERDDIDWVFKNGDSGQQYFSIVYLEGFNIKRLFYADYIVKMKDGTVWVIETKGGEAKGKDKNVDKQVENKFNAFKEYASTHNVKWGFVRDKDGELYINNTEYIKDLASENWKPLKDEF